MAQTRRAVLATTAAVFGLAGCLETNGDGFAAETDEEAPEPFPDLSAEQLALVERLQQDRTVESASSDETELRIEMQTTGDIDEDRRVVAEVYLNFVQQLAVDLRGEIVDRGLREATFRIEIEWAQQFADGEIDPDTYLELVAETTDT